MIERLLIFGATGDLFGRFLLPALVELYDEGRLSGGFRVVGTARENWDDETFRRHAARRLEQHADTDVSADSREALVRSLRYRKVDFEDRSSVAEAVAAVNGEPVAGAKAEPVAAYLALPPAVFPAAVSALGAVGLPSGSRIVLEKPFGEDLNSAVELNRLLERGGRGRGRAGGLPGRPRPGDGDGAEPASGAAGQPGPGAGVEQRAHRAGRHPLGRDPGTRGAGQLLRQDRRAQGRDPEPPAADPVPDRDGTAGQPRGAGPARPQARRAALGAPDVAGRRGVTVSPRPLHRRPARRHRRRRRADRSGLRRGGRGRPGARHRDLRRGRARARELAVGRHPLRAAHRQGPGKARARRPWCGSGRCRTCRSTTTPSPPPTSCGSAWTGPTTSP